ncbi:MAG: ABC transporter ATP-binding protein [Nakamurella sp.]
MGEIVLNKVCKTYGRKATDELAVTDLSYVIAAGHFVTLLGPSGCGKTTTLNMIAGLEDISGGTITIDGKRVDELPPDRRDLAYVFQDYALYPHMSVYDNMAFGLKMRKTGKTEIDRRVRDAAHRLDIAHVLDRKPRELSGGQRQRVALGRAIARRPSVFLFDEPLSNLDALLRDQTRSELKQLHQELDATSVYVTHDQEEALTLSDRIAVMSNGHLEQYGTPEEVYHAPATEFVASFVGKPRMNIYTASRAERGRYVVPGTPLTVSVHADVPDIIRIGLRPDELAISTTPSDAGTQATVRLVEPLGNATDLILELGEQTCIARHPGFLKLAPGDQVWIDATHTRQHIFDPGTGQRLGEDKQGAVAGSVG